MIEDDRTDRTAQLPPGVRLGLGLAAAAYLAITAGLIWATPVLAPYSDMLDWVGRYFDFQSNHDLGAYLLAPHVSHRLVFTFLILWADIALFGGTSWLFVAVGVGLLLLTAGLLAAAARHAVKGDLGWVAGGVAAAFVLMPGGILDATLHICTVYIEALALAVAAILIATPADGTAPGPGRLALALACAAASAFGNAVGLAVWPVLVFAAWRRSRVEAGVILAVGLGFGLIYFAGRTGAAALTTPGAAAGGLASLARAGLMFLSYLGLPWTRAVPRLGWLLGLMLCGLSIWAVLRRGGPTAPRAERVAVQLIAFSLVTAVMAAAGRNGAEAPTDTPLRYAVLLTPMHVGLVILAAPLLGGLYARRPRQTQGLMLVAALLLVLHQLAAGLFVVRTADINRARVEAFKAGDRSPEVTQVMYPDAAKAEAMLARMRAAGIYQGEWRRGR